MTDYSFCKKICPPEGNIYGSPPFEVDLHWCPGRSLKIRDIHCAVLKLSNGYPTYTICELILVDYSFLVESRKELLDN